MNILVCAINTQKMCMLYIPTQLYTYIQHSTYILFMLSYNLDYSIHINIISGYQFTYIIYMYKNSQRYVFCTNIRSPFCFLRTQNSLSYLEGLTVFCVIPSSSPMPQSQSNSPGPQSRAEEETWVGLGSLASRIPGVTAVTHTFFLWLLPG